MKKIKVRTPSGKLVIRSGRRKIGINRCANCKAELHGMPRMHAAAAGKLSKTERRPTRIYGGYLCGNCTKDLFREKARVI
ncbi:MAG: 50S ribosomal protein L34e [Candidatus Aenigmarchaeota archaeon]|nr:50S ribosomal protein L34e [Candidatus Aenigmarchaeota archaeon]